MMHEVKVEFEKRKNEILEYYSFIVKINNAKLLHEDKVYPIKIGIAKTMKSTVYLLLYNLVESIVSMCLSEIHQNINNNEINYSQFNDNIKGLYSDYFMSLNKSKKKEFLEKISGHEFIELDFTEIQGVLKLFSGNLDKRKIFEISKRYDLKIKSDMFGDKLLKVKSVRNDLAHGSISFSECCKDELIQSTKEVIDDVISFLEIYINFTKEYVSNHKYINSNVLAEKS